MIGRTLPLFFEIPTTFVLLDVLADALISDMDVIWRPVCVQLVCVKGNRGSSDFRKPHSLLALTEIVNGK